MVAAHLVLHHHVERRRGGALLVVAVHVEALGVGAAVEELVDGARVAVEGHHHVGAGGEQLEEARPRTCRAGGRPAGRAS